MFRSAQGVRLKFYRQELRKHSGANLVRHKGQRSFGRPNGTIARVKTQKPLEAEVSTWAKCISSARAMTSVIDCKFHSTKRCSPPSSHVLAPGQKQPGNQQ